MGPGGLYFECTCISGTTSGYWYNHSPVLMFSAVTGVIYALQYFTQAMIASRVAAGVTDAPGTSFVPGYPEMSTLTLPQWLFQTGFRDYTMGYACVLALVLFAASMVFTLVLLRQFRGFEEVAS